MQHADRLQRRDDAAVCMRVEERCVVRANDDVRLIEQVHGAAGHQPLHRGDHRLPDRPLLRTEPRTRVLLTPRVDVVPPRGLLEIHASAERSVTVGPKHECVDAVVASDALPGVGDVERHLFVERVVSLRTVQRHRCDMSVGIKLDGGIRDCHRVPSSGYRRTDIGHRAYDDLVPSVVGTRRSRTPSLLGDRRHACQISTTDASTQAARRAVSSDTSVRVRSWESARCATSLPDTAPRLMRMKRAVSNT
jgi:hypothetical protein